jgi:hypothetical protein
MRAEKSTSGGRPRAMNLEEVDAWIKQGFQADADEFATLMATVKQALQTELGAREGSGMVRIDPESVKSVVVIGDIHGDLVSLTHILKQPEVAEADRIVFLGDYGDRGDESVVTYFVVFTLKALLNGNERVTLMRGNHEGPPDLRFSPHELPFYFVQRFGEQGKELYRALKDLWSYLPYATLIAGRYMLIHGGVPCHVSSLNEVAYARDSHPASSTLKELLWNDPIEGNGCFESFRGAGNLFGRNVTAEFLCMANVTAVIRSHEFCEGVETRHEGKILTVFSRKGEPYYNTKAAYLLLDEELLRESQDAYTLARRAARVW